MDCVELYLWTSTTHNTTPTRISEEMNKKSCVLPRVIIIKRIWRRRRCRVEEGKKNQDLGVRKVK